MTLKDRLLHFFAQRKDRARREAYRKARHEAYRNVDLTMRQGEIYLALHGMPIINVRDIFQSTETVALNRILEQARHHYIHHNNPDLFPE